MRGRLTAVKFVTYCAFSVVLDAVAAPAAAANQLSVLLDRLQLSAAYPDNPDLVTAYATEMVRTRLELMARRSLASFAMPLAPTHLRAEFRMWTWRAADGSLLQGFAGKGGFRLTLGNCLSSLCSSQECVAEEWPAFECSDGRKRTMAVKDFTSAEFDGVAYRRLSAPAGGQGG